MRKIIQFEITCKTGQTMEQKPTEKWHKLLVTVPNTDILLHNTPSQTLACTKNTDISRHQTPKSRSYFKKPTDLGEVSNIDIPLSQTPPDFSDVPNTNTPSHQTPTDLNVVPGTDRRVFKSKVIEGQFDPPAWLDSDSPNALPGVSVLSGVVGGHDCPHWCRQITSTFYEQNNWYIKTHRRLKTECNFVFQWNSQTTSKFYWDMPFSSNKQAKLFYKKTLKELQRPTFQLVTKIEHQAQSTAVSRNNANTTRGWKVAL